MDCHDFDGQVVRFETIQDLAEKFIFVRLTRIDGLNLNLFDFDYDLTLAYFFLNGDGKIYSRYGSRDGSDPDSRQSLKGLRNTMESVLIMHSSNKPEFVEPRINSPLAFSQLMQGSGINGCAHCHQVREALNRNLINNGKWERNMIWRFPLPENIGLTLDVDKGNQVKKVHSGTPAQKIGLQAGDQIHSISALPIHSIADIQHALDRCPNFGKVNITWFRKGNKFNGELELENGWKKTDISWRPSHRKLVPMPGIYGTNLTENEKSILGIPPKQLAFRHKDGLSDQAKASGIKGGDIVLGIKGSVLEMDVDGFFEYIRQNYFVGETVYLQVIRDGKKLFLPMLLIR